MDSFKGVPMEPLPVVGGDGFPQPRLLERALNRCWDSRSGWGRRDEDCALMGKQNADARIFRYTYY